MRLVLTGAPGAGKGTQAELIARRYGVPHVSTGDMFRQAVHEGTPMGVAARSYMDKGLLVPDEVTVGLVRERLAQPDCRVGFVLDGFPRNVEQASALERLLDEMGMPLDAVVYIDVPEEDLIERASGRRVCSCGATYHMKYNLPRVDGKCDYCGRELMHRRDDRPEVIAERLKTYADQTRPLIEYYERRSLLLKVDGRQDIESVFEQIVSALERADDCH